MDQSKSPVKHNVREHSLDYLRGTAVILMILAHALFFFHDESDPVLNAIARTGNVVCFVAFLFVSGASLYFSYLRDRPADQGVFVRKVLRRTFIILCGYYFLAIMARVETLRLEDVPGFGLTLLRILLFIDLPGFTEFLFPFIFFTLSIVLFRSFYARVARHLLTTLEAGYALYLVAYALYPIELPSPWREVKALFVGDEGLNRFPLLQYMPVLLLGMYWGHFLHTHESKQARYRQSFRLGLVFAGIATVATMVSRTFPLAVLDPVNRWPPSIGFISIGLGFAFGMHLLFSLATQPRWSRWFWQLLEYFGLDAFDLFTVHIVLLYFYRFFWGRHYSDVPTVLLLTLGLIILSVILSSFHMSNSASLFKMGPLAIEQPGHRRFKKRYLLGTAAFISLIVWNLNHDMNVVTYGETIGRNEVVGESLRDLPEITSTHIREGVFRWYDESYTSHRQITVQNERDWVSLKDGDTVVLTLDHLALVQSGESRPDGSDLIMVYYGVDAYEPLPFEITEANTDHAKISFPLRWRIAPEGGDNRYFLYWGTTTPAEHDVPVATASQSEGYRIDIGERHSSLLVATLDRSWQVIGLPSGVKKLPLTLRVLVTDPTLVAPATGVPGPAVPLVDTTLWYRVEGTDLAGPMVREGDSTFVVEVPTDTLKTGSYRVSAYLFSGENQIQSRSVPFSISQPVLVAWTMDWEGWDVPDSTLRSIENQVVRHGNIPVTHFFSPRIYLESVLSPERAEYLTTKVSTWAQKYRHEIQLHLHMQYDLVEAAGVVPRTEPRWGYKSAEGYDVPTTTYTAEELTQIVKWGENQFLANGLPTPMGYRAGGWFADETTLSVLDSLGFLYDSSGREQKMWGGSGTSPWNLGATTQPYHPSIADQNKSGSPSFGLLEIPNNGADAYGYSGEQMLVRFRENFNGEPLDQKRVVTYISHPEWQRTDEPKMDEVLGATDQLLYQNGQGPVIYVTLGQVYALWN